ASPAAAFLGFESPWWRRVVHVGTTGAVQIVSTFLPTARSRLRSSGKGRRMLNEPAFASSLTILTGAFYIILYLLAIISRDAFRFLFNAQFFGADVASLLPQRLTAGGFVATLVAILIFVWIFG